MTQSKRIFIVSKKQKPRCVTREKRAVSNFPPLRSRLFSRPFSPANFHFLIFFLSGNIVDKTKTRLREKFFFSRPPFIHSSRIYFFRRPSIVAREYRNYGELSTVEFSISAGFSRHFFPV